MSSFKRISVYYRLLLCPSLAFLLAASTVADKSIAQDTVVAQVTPSSSSDQGGTPTTSSGTNLTIGSDGPQITATSQVASNPNQKKDAPTEQKEKKNELTWIDRIAGSALYTQFEVSLGTFAKNYYPTYNPTLSQFVVFSPRFRINKDWQLRGRIAASLEYTDSDSSTKRNQFLLSDTVISLYYQGLAAVGGEKVKVKLSPFVGLTFPTSLASQARTLYVSPSFGLQLNLPVEMLGGDWQFLAAGSYAHPFYQYTTPQYLGGQTIFADCAGGAGCGSQLSGQTNPRDVFTWSVLVSASYGIFSPGVYLLMNHQLPYAPTFSDSATVRQSSYFAAWLDLDLNSWLTTELGYQMISNVLGADGKYTNPIYSKYGAPLVYLGVNIQLGALIKSFEGQKTGPGGIVRGDNRNKVPFKFY